MMELSFIQDGQKFDIKDFGYVECLNIKQSPPEIEFNNLLFESEDGERESNNNTFRSFEIETRLMYRHDNIYDKKLREAELLTFFAKRSSYYLIYEYMPGKRYPIQFVGFEEEGTFTRETIIILKFNCFKAFSESIESTMSEQDITIQSWQYSQGLVPVDYQYKYKKNNFSIYNLGDFTIDPRKKHYLKIVLKGESDGKVTIVNKTNDSKFIYNNSLSSRKGETIELDGIEPYKNGVPCGIDCPSIGPIILAPGENKIQIQNTSNVEVFFDFRFLYRT